MKKRFQPKIIGIDLLQDSYQIYSKDPGFDSPDKSMLLPSALLPLYPGEKGIFGYEALNHRRAKGWQHPAECTMFWNSDVTSGCGRVIVAAAMQRLVDHHYAWGSHKSGLYDSFSWQPFKDRQILSSAEIITNTVQVLAPSSEAVIALPLPDSSTHSAQQALLNAFYSKNNPYNRSGSSLILIKRSIAQAMIWCDKHQSDLLERGEPYDGEHAGHLLVINLGVDCWEARLVPLQWYLWEEAFYLVPVDSEYLPRENLQTSGLQLAANQLRLRQVRDESLWQALVGQELLNDLFSNQQMTSEDWQQFFQVSASHLPHTEDLFAHSLPQLAEIEHILKKLVNRKNELRHEESNLLGIMIDGCCAQWFSNLNLFGWLKQAKQRDFITSTKSDEPSIAARGAQLYAQCHTNASPSYLVELMPISIWCRNSVRYGQEFIWKPLVSQNTIPAGRSSQLESCPGFLLPAGHNELQLILRRPSIDSEQDYEYRKIPVKIFEKFNTNVNVTIAVEIKPGSGQAKAKLLSDDGHLLSELDWKKMSICEKPNEHQSSYLARTCEALSEGSRWNELARQLEKLKLRDKLKRRRSLDLLQDSLDSIHALFNKSRVKPDKRNGYEEWRVISSDGKVDEYGELVDILAEFLEACYFESVRQSENDIRKKTLQVMRHLFTAATKNTRLAFLKKLESTEVVTMQELLCMGQAFKEAAEITKFLQAFLTTIRSEVKGCFYWLRALRSILRYRYEAFDPEIVEDTFYQHLWDAITEKIPVYENHPKILRSAIQCLIYMLGRRRFNKSFVVPGSMESTELNQAIQKIKVNRSIKELLDQLAKLLNCNAAEGDIQLLLSSEVSSDED